MTSSNSTKLSINADGTIKLPNDNQKLTIGSSEDLQFYHTGNHSRILESGTGKLQLGSDTQVEILNGAFSVPIAQFNPGGSVVLRHNTTTRLETTTTGVAITGLLSATTKSFIIDHPTKENYKLRYACLEGPENSVYIRGRTTDNVIELPDYWTGLVDEDSITVNLTPIGNHSIWIEEINNNKVYINSESKINCFYIVFAERKDVEKLIVEIQEN